MKLIINGKEHNVRAKNVEDLVAELGLPLAAALVEHNSTALLRGEWRATVLNEGDRIEIIRMVAGG